VKVVGIEILEQETHGGPDGFLVLHRTRIQNKRADGSLSEPYVCDFVERPRSQDAVVVALFHRAAHGVEVLIRDGLRPPLSLGRSDTAALFCSEAVAGLIELTDIGEDGIRQRAVLEVFEEAGYRVTPTDIEFLGALTYPAPGAIPEAFRLCCAEIRDPLKCEVAPGDGSPMEEGAMCRWMPLGDAIRGCVEGEIQDLKTEVVLRRLRDWLGCS